MADHDRLAPPGEVVDSAQLRTPRGVSLERALRTGQIAYATICECRRTENADVLIVDLDVEVPQEPVYAIEYRERLAIVFRDSDNRPPKVLALRPDFPRVPHLNLEATEFPRSFCLYDQPWADLKRRWTAPAFIDRIRDWLALTAKGMLHQDDQPLEPLLLDYGGHIALPRSLTESDDVQEHPKTLFLTLCGGNRGSFFFVAHSEKPPAGIRSLPALIAVHKCPPQQHGVIRRQPGKLSELAEFVGETGLDLINEFTDRLRDVWQASGDEDASFLQSYPIVVVLFPKTRTPDGEPESIDTWAFLVDMTVKETGIKLGIWGEHADGIVPLVGGERIQAAEDIAMSPLNPSFHLSPDVAAAISGLQISPADLSIVAVGVGALGSQVVSNLARSGFGRWTLIDHDALMPHNVVRHALDGSCVGFNKAFAEALSVNSLFPERQMATAIPANLLSAEGEQAGQISEAFKGADLILDMSASVSVPRAIAREDAAPARCVSVFLNPSGNDLVILAEDGDRSIRLDDLEAQYYRAVVTDDRLQDHLRRPSGRRRYGQGCRDVTFRLCQDRVALHAAIASSAIRRLPAEPHPLIAIWRSDDSGNVTRIEIPPADVVSLPYEDWDIRIDESCVDALFSARGKKLPRETGGVLIGSYDLERRTIYVAHTILSPPDSKEQPTCYIRGCKGLKQEVQQVAIRTSDMFEYVGEWHSHPNGVPPLASAEDRQVFGWIADHLAEDGLPAVMIIVGEGRQLSCYFGEIDDARTISAKAPTS